MYQTDYKLTKHPVRPVKNKAEGLADINCIHILERFRNFCSYCDDRKVYELFLNDCLYNYFLVAQSMLQYRLKRKPSAIFPRISAHTPISALPRLVPTLQVVVSNKRSSRISADPSFLAFFNSRDTKKTCFYCHFIYNFLAYNYSGISTGK